MPLVAAHLHVYGRPAVEVLDARRRSVGPGVVAVVPLETVFAGLGAAAVADLRPARFATGSAVGTCARRIDAVLSIALHMGGRTALAEARLYDGGDRLCAHATSSCMIFRPPS